MNNQNQNEFFRLSVRIPWELFITLLDYELLFEDLNNEEREILYSLSELDISEIVRKSFHTPLLTATKRTIRQEIKTIKSNRINK